MEEPVLPDTEINFSLFRLNSKYPTELIRISESSKEVWQ